MFMNNSDQPLTSFEEKLTAYVDGRLSETEAAAFEHAHPEAVQERATVSRVTSALKRGSVAPALSNPEFFNRQVVRQITSAASANEAAPERQPSFFSLWRLVFGAAMCLLLAAGIYRGFVMENTPSAKPYLAQVLSVKTGDATLTTRLISEEGLTVVMIDGLEPMSEEFILN
jgi:anti-sigma factor RsiW